MLQFVKIGTNCLFNNGIINYSLLEQKAREIETLPYDSVIVMSGAIKLGKWAEGQIETNDKLTNVQLQGYASIGQPLMMKLCETIFTRKTAQVIVTMEDLKHTNYIKNLVYENIKRKRITIFNYNDSVDFMELRKDNDTLAAELTVHCDARRLVILGNYDGFCHGRHLQERITEVTDKMYTWCGEKSTDGNGGFGTKLDAARFLLAHGKEMIVGNIHYHLDEIIHGKVPRTLFAR